MTYASSRVRRERAISRALTRAVYEHSTATLALINHLKTVDDDLIDPARAEVHVTVDDAPLVDYWVDGTRTTSKHAAASLLQDRYGITHAEAEALIPEQVQPASPSPVSRVRGIR